MDQHLFTNEILRSYFASTVREMFKSTTHTAYSIVFSEGLDFSCALFDGRRRTISLESGNPVHMASLPSALDCLCETYPQIDPGDILVMNDPYRGGTHHADVVVVRPIFWEDHLVAYGINRGHWTDIGGMTAGGFSGAARDVIQEGLIIPPIKLYRRGELVPELKDFILSNVRVKQRVWGDLQAQIAAGITAERRIHDLIRKYGLDQVLEGMDYAVDYARRRFTRGLEAIPDGRWSNSQYMEDDGIVDQPRTIAVTVAKQGDRVTVDYRGSSIQALGPINAALAVTKAATYCALTAIVDPHTPLNQGVFDCVEIVAPAGTLVNPAYPAPLFGGNCDTAAMIFETVVRAFAAVTPERVIGGHIAGGMNTTAWGQDPANRDEFSWYLFIEGGWGARATKDGNSATFHAMGNCKSQPIEIWESRNPACYERYELLPDSGGAGRFRGGLGVIRDIRLTADETLLSALADRFHQPPFGIFGGQPGWCNAFRLQRGDRPVQTLREWFGLPSFGKFSNLSLQRGDLLTIQCAGGGGYGDPLERSPGLVAHDLLNGYISAQAAWEIYGVRIDPTTGTIDAEQTRRQRAHLRALREQAPMAAAEQHTDKDVIGRDR